MGTIAVFNQVSLDGYFVDRDGDMQWAKNACPDAEFDAFVADNAGNGGTLLLGRVTYELMVSYWPTPLAQEHDPVVAAAMNALPKVVVSRTLDHVAWRNTTLVKGDLLATARSMKQESGNAITILGSGTIVAQLAQAGLIDAYQIIVIPIVLGGGRTLFDGIPDRFNVHLTTTRTFGNGNVLLCYEPGG